MVGDVSKAGTANFMFSSVWSLPSSPKRLISILSDKSVKIAFCQSDNVPTQFGVYRLDEVLNFLKGKCYINVDKYPIDVPVFQTLFAGAVLKIRLSSMQRKRQENFGKD